MSIGREEAVRVGFPYSCVVDSGHRIPLRSDGSVVLVYLRLEAEIKTFELISERFRFLAEVLHGFCAPRYAHAKQAQRVCHRLEAGARNHRAQRLTRVFKIPEE